MDPQSGVPLALGLKFVLLILLPSEGPHHPHGGEVLLSAGGHLPSASSAVLNREEIFR